MWSPTWLWFRSMCRLNCNKLHYTNMTMVHILCHGVLPRFLLFGLQISSPPPKFKAWKIKYRIIDSGRWVSSDQGNVNAKKCSYNTRNFDMFNQRYPYRINSLILVSYPVASGQANFVVFPLLLSFGHHGPRALKPARYTVHITQLVSTQCCAWYLSLLFLI